MKLLAKRILQFKSESEFPCLKVKDIGSVTHLDSPILSCFAKLLKIHKVCGTKLAKSLLGKKTTWEYLITMSDDSPIAYIVTRGNHLQELHMVPSHLTACKNLLAAQTAELSEPGAGVYRKLVFFNPEFRNSNTQTQEILKQLEALWNAMMASPYLPEVANFEYSESEAAEYFWKVESAQRLHWTSRKSLIRAEKIIREMKQDLQGANWLYSFWIHQAKICGTAFRRSVRLVPIFASNE